MHIRLSPSARNDLLAMRDYLEPRSPSGLDRILSAIFTTLLNVEPFPFLGRIGRVEGTRELIIPATGYIVIYTLPDEYHIDVERIIHGRQQWPPEDES